MADTDAHQVLAVPPPLPLESVPAPAPVTAGTTTTAAAPAAPTSVAPTMPPTLAPVPQPTQVAAAPAAAQPQAEPLSPADMAREIDIPDVDPLADDHHEHTGPHDVSVEMQDIPTAPAAHNSVDRIVAIANQQQRMDPTSVGSVRKNREGELVQTPGAVSSASTNFATPAPLSFDTPAPQRGTSTGGASNTSKQPATSSIADAPNAAGAHGGFFNIPDCIRLHPTLGAYLAEIIGTFIYVFTIALVEINNPTLKEQRDANTSPLPIGFALIGMVFTFGYISGGHFNPAISFAVFFARRHEFGFFRMLAYVVCQCGAGVAAGIVAMIVQGSNDIIVPDVNNDSEFIRKGLFAELIFTFALATVVLNVAYSHQRANFFYGFAIGFVVIAGISAVGGVTGGAFNPAVATGLQASVCLVGRCKPLMHFWLYWIAPFGGALLAAFIFISQYIPDADGNNANADEQMGARVIR